MSFSSSFSLHSVRTRLTVWNVGVLALVLVVLGAVFGYRVRVVALNAVDHRMVGSANHLQEMMNDRPYPPSQFPGRWQRPPGPLPGRSERGPFGELRPHLLNLQGKPLLPLPPNAAPGASGNEPWDMVSFAASLRGREVYSTIQVNQEPVRVLSVPLRQQGKIIGVAQFAHSLAQIQQDEHQMTRTLLALIPLALLVAGLGGAFLTDRALRPVRQITQTASRIEAGNLSGRLPITGRDEFAALAETFNGMLSRLESAFGDLGNALTQMEQAYEQQRRFTADASHELRTPLTIIKANASLALTGTRTPPEYQKMLRAVDVAADRMNRIVQDLLLLARSDARQLTFPLVPVSLAEILEQAVDTILEPERPPMTLDLPPRSLQVLGQGDMLVRLFTNLLENAIRHTPPTGQVTVSASCSCENVIVIVADTGEEIAPEHLPHVTERFYRVDAARARSQGGVGLGLSICRSIVELHGGHLAIESSPGQGTKVRVTLPLTLTKG